ncbi:MAG: DUF2089 domain-containing protein [Chloroflexota bacterium]
MTQREVIATCPVCDHRLEVTRLHCPECDTTLEGRFSVGRFGRLGRDQLALLETFLRARGNLRDMEREMGISYPTVRNRLEALIRALELDVPANAAVGVAAGDVPAADPASGGDAAADATAAARRRILERLAAHEIDAQAAALALRSLEQVPEDSR